MNKNLCVHSRIVHEKYLNDLRNKEHKTTALFLSLEEFVDLKLSLGLINDLDVKDFVYQRYGIKIILGGLSNAKSSNN